MRIVEEQVSQSPQNMDVRAWRARVFTWSGKLNDAEQEYLRILAVVPNDPDDWLGLATVYLRENRSQDALKAADSAVDLDAKRADLHVTRAYILRALHQSSKAKAEFEEALILDPRSTEAHAGLASLKSEARHQLLLETNTDLFSFIGADHEQGATLISQWSKRWETVFGTSVYRWNGVNAEKINADVTAKSTRWAALTLGGAFAHDNGIIPKNEGFFAYDRGWRFPQAGLWRGLETNYEQHWYWYAGARILTFNETTTAYFPRDWVWSLRLTAAQSQFPGTGAQWRPAGLTKIAFPITRSEAHRLGGTLLFATGTENYSQVNQVGHFTSHTYGGGLRFRVTAAQDLNGLSAYQQRTDKQSEISFGFGYDIRF